MSNEKEPLFSIEKGFLAVEEFGGLIHQSVMPIVTQNDKGITALGTAFCIHPNGLLVTAKHVIKDWANHTAHSDPIYALYVSNQKHPDKAENYVGGLIPIIKVSWSLELDIAYCLLQPKVKVSDGSQLTFPPFPVSAKIPEAGQNILCFGYFKNQFSDTEQNEDGMLVISNSRESVSTTGVVTDIFPDGRDKGMLNFPCFQTDSRFELGMSGGPIINEKGYVFGVVCSGLIQEGEIAEHVTFGSLLGPSFPFTLKGWFSDIDSEREFSVQDLINAKSIKSD